MAFNSNSLERFQDALSDALQRRDGARLALLLDPADQLAKSAAAQLLRQSEASAQNSNASNDVTLAEKLLLSRGAFAAREHYDAFIFHESAMTALFREYDNSTGNWMCRAVVMMCSEHRIIAQQAYEEVQARKLDVETLSKAEDVIRKFFRKSIQDKQDSPQRTKKLSVLALSVQLFKIHFKLRTLNLCADVIRLIDSMIIGVIDFELFPMAHKVAYCYFVGRLALYDQMFARANENLSYAFERVPSKYAENKRQIVQYLACTRMNLGIMPSSHLLREYKLEALEDIRAAICSGNMRQFRESLEDRYAYFTRTSMYPAVMRLETLVLRTLARRLFLILRPVRMTRIPLHAYISVIEDLQVNMDEDEVECVLGNLIFDGLMKGYISHSRKTLVLSNQTAFPKIWLINYQIEDGKLERPR